MSRILSVVFRLQYVTNMDDSKISLSGNCNKLRKQKNLKKKTSWRKKKNTRNQHFFPFSTMFSIILNTEIIT